MSKTHDMTETDDGTETVHRTSAETRTESGATIRLRRFGPRRAGPSEWTDVVEIETADGEVIRVGEWSGHELGAIQRYNTMVEPYTDDDGNERYGREQ